MKKNKIQMMGFYQINTHEMKYLNGGFIITGGILASIMASGLLVAGVVTDVSRLLNKGDDREVYPRDN